MNIKFYVSEAAEELLKKKGYQFIWGYDSIHPKKVTKAEAIDWLDSKEIYIQIGGVGSGTTQKWSYSVFDYKTYTNYPSDYIYSTRLEAEDAAIIKALELL